jgi:hypothetical protein
MKDMHQIARFVSCFIVSSFRSLPGSPVEPYTFIMHFGQRKSRLKKRKISFPEMRPWRILVVMTTLTALIPSVKLSHMSDERKTGKRKGRPPKDPTTPTGGRSNVHIGGRIHPKVCDAFSIYIQDFNREHNLKTEKSAHFEKAIAMYLHAMGREIEGLPPHLQAPP